jgi:HK97 gp10 family phage protein
MPRFDIKAIKIEAERAGLEAARAALAAYEIKVVDAAKELAPVRQPFKNPSKARKKTRELTGKHAYLDVGETGRGSLMLKRRQTKSELNKKARMFKVRGVKTYGLDLGVVGHRQTKTSGEVRTFTGPARETSSSHSTGKAFGGGLGRVQSTQGFILRSSYRQQALTSRARYNLKHGIGVRKESIGSTEHLVFGGALRESIHGRGVEETKGGAEVYITADVRYAKYVEYGTYKDYAQPFLRPAIKNTQKQLKSIMKSYLQGTGFKVRG